MGDSPLRRERPPVQTPFAKHVQQMRFRTQAVHISPTVSAKRAFMVMLDLDLLASPALRARAAPRTLCLWQTVPVIQASTGVRVMVSNALPVQQTPLHLSPVRVSSRTARAMPVCFVWVEGKGGCRLIDRAGYLAHLRVCLHMHHFRLMCICLLLTSTSYHRIFRFTHEI